MKRNRAVLCLIILFVTVGIPNNQVAAKIEHLTRDEIISRALKWVERGVKYSQGTVLEDGYRRDCSGFVSYAWNLGVSANTKTLVNYAVRINKEDLKPGDILLWEGTWGCGGICGGHVVIFNGWANDARTEYFAIEQTARGGINKAIKEKIAYPYPFGGNNYIPYRYKNILEIPSGYSLCAKEGQKCNFNGLKEIAYGTNGKYVYRSKVSTGIMCSTSTFGDPTPGLAKGCFIKDSPKTPPDSSWSSCAEEGQFCSFRGVKDVAYGVYGKFRYKTIILNGISCSNNTFGDPYSGISKICYTKNSVNTPPAGYKFCANEGQRCTGRIGLLQSFAYGAYGKFVYKTNLFGRVNCNNFEFGDPFPGVAKACYIK